MSNEWKQTSKPNLNGTEMGDLVKNLETIRDHFVKELELELSKLDYLEKKRESLIVQQKKRKVRSSNG